MILNFPSLCCKLKNQLLKVKNGVKNNLSLIQSSLRLFIVLYYCGGLVVYLAQFDVLLFPFLSHVYVSPFNGKILCFDVFNIVISFKKFFGGFIGFNSF